MIAALLMSLLLNWMFLCIIVIIINNDFQNEPIIVDHLSFQLTKANFTFLQLSSTLAQLLSPIYKLDAK